MLWTLSDLISILKNSLNQTINVLLTTASSPYYNIYVFVGVFFHDSSFSSALGNMGLGLKLHIQANHPSLLLMLLQIFVSHLTYLTLFLSVPPNTTVSFRSGRWTHRLICKKSLYKDVRSIKDAFKDTRKFLLNRSCWRYTLPLSSPVFLHFSQNSEGSFLHDVVTSNVLRLTNNNNNFSLNKWSCPGADKSHWGSTTLVLSAF